MYISRKGYWQYHNQTKLHQFKCYLKPDEVFSDPNWIPLLFSVTSNPLRLVCRLSGTRKTPMVCPKVTEKKNKVRATDEFMFFKYVVCSLSKACLLISRFRPTPVKTNFSVLRYNVWRCRLRVCTCTYLHKKFHTFRSPFHDFNVTVTQV